MFKCKTCGIRFPETKGTVFYNRHLKGEQIILICKLLVERKGIRAIERIMEIITRYYHIPNCGKNSFKIPELMKERWKKLPDHEKTISEILVLEMLFDLNQPRRTYEIISRLKDFLEDVASIIKDLGVGEMTIHKRKDRPHYRSYLPKKVRENLNELRKNVETSKLPVYRCFFSYRKKLEITIEQFIHLYKGLYHIRCTGDTWFARRTHEARISPVFRVSSVRV